MPKKIVIIGGTAAGPKAASKARRLDQKAEITIIQKDNHLSVGSCGYPYYVSGDVRNANQLVLHDSNSFWANKRINAITNTEAVKIDRKKKVVTYIDLKTNESNNIKYDRLVIATGATAIKPPIPGIELDGVTAHTKIEEACYLAKIQNVKEAVIVGGGLIGIETAEALTLKGIKTTIIEMQTQILQFLDPEIAALVEVRLEAKGVKIVTGKPVTEFLGKDGKIIGVKLANGKKIEAQLAVLAIGVKPNVQLAVDANLEIGKLGGIKVNNHLQTSDKNIFAAGDCIETIHRLTGEKVLAPFGDLANLQGRIVAQNLFSSHPKEYPGTILSGICKVFDYSAGSTGLNEKDAKRIGQPVETIVMSVNDKPSFMPDSKVLIIKLVVDPSSKLLLGVQCIGEGNTNRIITQAAIAIQAHQTIDDLVSADLPYAPPFSPAIDNLITAAHIMENKLAGLFNGVSCLELKQQLKSKKKLYILDVRTDSEFTDHRLDIGETLIPLHELRERAEELPTNKKQEIICYCRAALRSYEAALIMNNLGHKNVKILEGGILAWPF
jgi:NADPH-dependent 2,4-dienoyl-CoA reductase/sulfur reductase-like enzyme/rhodanese-related sulfurtransferase